MSAFLTAAVLCLGICFAILWPSKTPYVTLKGADLHETIWFWRAPIYYDHYWYIRWSWTDPFRFRAYCFDPEESARWAAAHPGMGMNMNTDLPEGMR